MNATSPRRRLARATALLDVAALGSAGCSAGADVAVDTLPASKTSLAVPGAGSDPAAPAERAGRPAGQATPDEAVIAWLEAVGAGDTKAAAELTGPRSARYTSAAGGDLEGMLTEAGEGYGGWADVQDRSTTEVEISEDLVVVAVSGTWRGEGADGFRVEAIPAVRDPHRGWVVEPWALGPRDGRRVRLVNPAIDDEGNAVGQAADAVLEAAAAGDGDFYFSLDDEAPTKVTGAGAGGARGRFDPAGDMRSGSHLLVVAYVDGEAISAVGTMFAVEG